MCRLARLRFLFFLSAILFSFSPLFTSPSRFLSPLSRAQLWRTFGRRTPQNAAIQLHLVSLLGESESARISHSRLQVGAAGVWPRRQRSNKMDGCRARTRARPPARSRFCLFTHVVFIALRSRANAAGCLQHKPNAEATRTTTPSKEVEQQQQQQHHHHHRQHDHWAKKFSCPSGCSGGPIWSFLLEGPRSASYICC